MTEIIEDGAIKGGREVEHSVLETGGLEKPFEVCEVRVLESEDFVAETEFEDVVGWVGGVLLNHRRAAWLLHRMWGSRVGYEVVAWDM